MISPILTYNSEDWGAFAKSDFKSKDSSAIEKTRLQFCKCCLEVHNKASNTACRAEVGKFPLIINKKILNYLNYLREKEESSIVKQSLKISIDLHYNGHNSFYSSLMKIRNTTKIWVVHVISNGISTLVTQTSFCEGSSGDLAKCRLFSQVIHLRNESCNGWKERSFRRQRVFARKS